MRKSPKHTASPQLYKPQTEWQAPLKKRMQTGCVIIGIERCSEMWGEISLCFVQLMFMFSFSFNKSTTCPDSTRHIHAEYQLIASIHSCVLSSCYSWWRLGRVERVDHMQHTVREAAEPGVQLACTQTPGQDVWREQRGHWELHRWPVYPE